MAARRKTDDQPRRILDEIAAIAWDISIEGYQQKDKIRDFKATFSGTASPEQARRCLCEILRHSKVLSNVAVLPIIAKETGERTASDPYATYFAEGQRSVGLMLLSLINARADDRPRPTEAQSRPD